MYCLYGILNLNLKCSFFSDSRSCLRSNWGPRNVLWHVGPVLRATAWWRSIYLSQDGTVRQKNATCMYFQMLSYWVWAETDGEEQKNKCCVKGCNHSESMYNAECCFVHQFKSNRRDLLYWSNYGGFWKYYMGDSMGNNAPTFKLNWIWREDAYLYVLIFCFWCLTSSHACKISNPHIILLS